MLVCNKRELNLNPFFLINGQSEEVDLLFYQDLRLIYTEVSNDQHSVKIAFHKKKEEKRYRYKNTSIKMIFAS
ncbi:hypothetical protein D3C86_1164150 [compost metagenome]